MAARGYVDGIVAGEVVGWALDGEHPGARTIVTGAFNGVPLPTVRADEARADLTRAGLGDGAHGFRMPIPGAAVDGGTYVVDVRPVGAAGHLPLAPDWVAHGRDGKTLEGVELREPDDAPAARPDVALVGRHGWLFGVPPAGPGRRLGAAPIPHAELDADIAVLEGLAGAAAAVGAVPCFVELADKAQVYPEHLPERVVADPTGRRARRLIARLRDLDQLTILDLHEALLDARGHGRVFPRTGAGLSWVGAFHAYRAVVKTLAPLRPELVARAVADVDLGPPEPVADSLIDRPLMSWDGAALVPASFETPSDTEPTLDLDGARIRAAGKVLIAHGDSGARIAALLGDHFTDRVTLAETALDPDAIRRHEPDVVVWLREPG